MREARTAHRAFLPCGGRTRALLRFTDLNVDCSEAGRTPASLVSWLCALAIAGCGQGSTGGKALIVPDASDEGNGHVDANPNPDAMPGAIASGDGAPGAGQDATAVDDASDAASPADGSSPAGKLVLDIAGTTQGTDYAFLKVAGRATLGGTLQLNFASGFSPPAGQKFVVVTAAGGIRGRFDSIVTNGVAVTAGQDATTVYVTVN